MAVRLSELKKLSGELQKLSEDKKFANAKAFGTYLGAAFVVAADGEVAIVARKKKGIFGSNEDLTKIHASQINRIDFRIDGVSQLDGGLVTKLEDLFNKIHSKLKYGSAVGKFANNAQQNDRSVELVIGLNNDTLRYELNVFLLSMSKPILWQKGLVVINDSFRAERDEEILQLIDTLGSLLPSETSSNGDAVSVADEIAKLKKLLDDGVISQSDFESAKAKLLR